MTAGYDGTVKIDTSLDTKGFDKGVEKVGNSFTKFANSMRSSLEQGFGNILSSIVLGVTQLFTNLISQVADFTQDSIKLASSLSDAFTGFDSIMAATGRSVGQANAFLKEFVSDGLVPLSDAVAAYKNLVVHGYDTSEIERMMIVMKDSAAFNRQAAFSIGEAVRRTSEGLRAGNSLTTDSVGIQKNLAQMWQDYADVLGISVDEMTLVQKRQAEINGFMEEGKFFMGDAAKAAQTYSGQMAGLQVSITNFSAAFGGIFIPILTRVIPLLREVIDWVTVGVQELANFMNYLFGIEQMSGKASSGIDDTAKSIDNLAKKTDKAKKSAITALAGFDQISKLNLAKDTGSGVIDTPAGQITMPVPVADDSALDAIKAKFEEWKQALLDLLQPAIEAFDLLKEALKPLGELAWAGLQWAWENILVPFGEWFISEALPVFLEVLAAGLELLTAVIIAMQPTIQWLWDEFLKPFAEWFGGHWINGMKIIAGWLRVIADWVRENPELFRKVVESFFALSAIIAFIALGPLAFLILAFASLIGMIDTAIKLFNNLSVQGPKAWAFIQNAWEKAPEWFDKSVIQPVQNFFAGLWSNLAVKAQDGLTQTTNKWIPAGGWFDLNVLTPIKNFFSSAFAFIGILANNGWVVVKDVWSKVPVWFDVNVLQPLGRFFKSAFDFIGILANNGWVFVSYVWGLASNWFTLNVINPLKNSFNSLYAELRTRANDAWLYIAGIWAIASGWFDANVINPIKNKFALAWASVKENAKQMLDSIFETFSNVGNWIDENIGNPIRNAFEGALSHVQEMFQNTFDGIYQTIKGILNSIIDLINGLLGNMSGGINEIINSLNSAGGSLPGWISIPNLSSPSIPYLAQGGVIPPNAERLVMVGDRTKGDEIIAPDEKIREIFRSELGQISGTVQIGFDPDFQSLAEIFHPYLQNVSLRIGPSLAKGS